MSNQELAVRHHQLELILQWEGRLNNARLRALFGLSPVRASEWIREFRERHPVWLDWDSKTRSFYPTVAFLRQQQRDTLNSRDMSNSLSRYLIVAGLPFASPVRDEPTVIWSAYPDISTPDPNIYSTLLAAARDQRVVTISYRSMRNPRPHDRTISPHSLVRVGRRWHARAFCDQAADFRDFSLGRISRSTIILDRVSSTTAADDVAWMTPVPVRIVAHPDLSLEQAELIRFECLNGTPALIEACRGALVNYFIQDIRAAITPTTQRPPDYQLAVENVSEIKQWLFSA